MDKVDLKVAIKLASSALDESIMGPPENAYRKWLRFIDRYYENHYRHGVFVGNICEPIIYNGLRLGFTEEVISKLLKIVEDNAEENNDDV